MGASTQDMVNQLLAQTTVAPSPSFGGLQAPGDPQQLQALLNKLRQQQYQEAATRPTGGQYGYLHDAGNLDAVQTAQNLGATLAPLGAPQQAPQSPTTGMAGTINQARQAYSAMVNNGVDPDTANVNTLKMLVAAGVPGADVELDKAQTKQISNLHLKGETDHNEAQAKELDQLSQVARPSEQRSREWTTTYTDPNGLYMLQKNNNGEVKRVELKPPPTASAQVAASATPDAVKLAADTYRTSGGDWGKVGPLGRSPAFQLRVLNQIAEDNLASGDTPGALMARSAALKAGTAASTQLEKQRVNTIASSAQLDLNLKKLESLADVKDDSGSPLLNRAINAYNQGVSGDKTTAALVTYLNAVENEYARLSSNSFGNSQLSVQAKNDAKEVINKNFSSGGIAAVAEAMRGEAQNKQQSLEWTRQQLQNQLSFNAPGTNGAGKDAPPQAPPPQPMPSGGVPNGNDLVSAAQAELARRLGK